MTELSAYRDLMTYAVTRRTDATALEDGEAIGCALAKHAHELAEKQRAASGQVMAAEHVRAWKKAQTLIDLIDPDRKET